MVITSTNMCILHPTTTYEQHSYDYSLHVSYEVQNIGNQKHPSIIRPKLHSIDGTNHDIFPPLQIPKISTNIVLLGCEPNLLFESRGGGVWR